ncbi:hypothetical protein FHS85_004548 [Rhodoligotrophos appendicifer]|uniref:hypothetical protein n=1 Tax=Rhodoligotrophos appendicifer TaxID=987056 RepID=UPI001184E267|nr:hypothetical protein [Rhodoligotrophos appendicifer]
MRSLSEVLAKASPGSKSLHALTAKYNTGSMTRCIAEYEIRDLHRRTGGKFGPLGPLTNPIQPHGDGGYMADTQLGTITLSDVSSPCAALQNYSTTVTLSGIRCFAAQDVETDELFAIVSLTCVNPNASGIDQTVCTMNTPITDTKSGDTVFRNMTIGNVPVVGSGISIHVSLWDHESGDVDEIRQKVAAAIEQATKAAQQAIAGGALGSDPAVTAGAVGDVTEFEIAGVKPFRVVTLELAGVIAEALADDLLGSKSFYVPAANLIEFADQAFYENSIRSDPALPFDVQINWPPRAGQEEPFTGKGAFYKAYFKIKTELSPIPCDPALR